MLAACCLRGRQTMLTGPEWLVLQAVHGLPKDQYGHAHDAEIVSDTGLRLHEVAPAWRASTGKGSCGITLGRWPPGGSHHGEGYS